MKALPACPPGLGEITLQRLLKAYEQVLPRYQVSRWLFHACEWAAGYSCALPLDSALLMHLRVCHTGQATRGHLLLSLLAKAQPRPRPQLVGQILPGVQWSRRQPASPAAAGQGTAAEQQHSKVQGALPWARVAVVGTGSLRAGGASEPEACAKAASYSLHLRCPAGSGRAAGAGPAGVWSCWCWGAAPPCSRLQLACRWGCIRTAAKQRRRNPSHALNQHQPEVSWQHSWPDAPGCQGKRPAAKAIWHSGCGRNHSQARNDACTLHSIHPLLRGR